MKAAFFLTISVVLGVFPSLATSAQFQPISQTQQCVDSDGRIYEEGERLGPFICEKGKWVYVGYMR